MGPGGTRRWITAQFFVVLEMGKKTLNITTEVRVFGLVVHLVQFCDNFPQACHQLQVSISGVKKGFSYSNEIKQTTTN